MSEKSNTAQKVVLWALVALWACFIFYLSSITGTQISDGHGLAQVYQGLRSLQAAIFGFSVDVLTPFLRFMEYFIFGLLLSAALSLHVSSKRTLIIVVITACVWGMLDEAYQSFVPGRLGSPLDWFVDVLGASFAGLFAFFFQNR